MHDVMIIGAGAAGLSAALMLGRSHRDVVILDGGPTRNATARQMHNVPTRDGTPPRQFRELAVRELDAYDSVAVERVETAAIERVDEGFLARLGDARVLSGRRVLLATGLADDLPDIPGMRELWGTSVVHCPYCHGWETNGRAIAVQGAAPARVRLALQLSRYGREVTLCTDGGHLCAEDRARLHPAGVRIRTESISSLVREGAELTAISFADGARLRTDFLFVASTTRQRSTIARSLGCAMLPDGGVEVDEFGRTSVPGVYAAGDMAHRNTLPMPLASVTAAAGAGQVAAGAIDQDLLCEDHDLPNPLASVAAGHPNPAR